MPTPWRRRLGKIALTIVVVVAVLALPWALAAPWLWSRLQLIAIAIDATLVLLAAIWWLWWRLPQRYVAGLALKIRDPKARADVEDNFRKTVGQALGGAAVLIGAGVAYLQFTQQQLTTYEQILTQQKAAEDSRQASQDLLISNQVPKGFEQLAGKETIMRLGGVYALEGVMNTSEQYHQPVLEALCAFVRDSTIPRQETLTVFRAARDKPAGKGDGTPATDVQAALTVIGRRSNQGPGVNLAGANIPGARLFEAHLGVASLVGAHLEGAILVGAHLENAFLAGAHFERADLRGAYLDYATSAGRISTAPTSGGRIS